MKDNQIFEQAILAMEEMYGSGCHEEIDSYYRGAKWLQSSYTIEEQHVGHSIDDLDKSYIKGFNEGAEWQKTEMEYFIVKFASWFVCYYTEEAFYNENYIKEMLEKYKKEKEL